MLEKARKDFFRTDYLTTKTKQQILNLTTFICFTLILNSQRMASTSQDQLFGIGARLGSIYVALALLEKSTSTE